MASRPCISFVLPAYNEAAGIKAFHEALAAELAPLESIYDFEMVYVNDGSRDGTGGILRGIAAADPRTSVIEFSRNFGHQIAITAGIDHAAGDAVIVMDTDLQDPPRTAIELIRAWEQGGEVVYAVRATRKDGFAKKLTARIFYRLMSALSDFPIPENAGDFRLFDRKAVEAMKSYREHDRYMRGIAAHIGFRQVAVPFDRDERRAGETHYPFRKMLRFALDAVLSFSTAPLRFMTRVGLGISLLSVAGIIYAVGVKLFFSSAAVPGWTFIIVSVFFLGGIQFIMLGMLGEYIGRIYAEAKGRPLYIVSSIHGKAQAR